jgi:hypothetical protein
MRQQKIIDEILHAPLPTMPKAPRPQKKIPMLPAAIVPVPDSSILGNARGFETSPTSSPLLTGSQGPETNKPFLDFRI